jgi:predicted transcriptional regulator
VKYRSREEIIESILHTASAKGGATKTRIMYSAFLSYTQLVNYLDTLISEDLLEYDSKNRVYRSKQKGLDFLKLNKEIADLIRVS